MNRDHDDLVVTGTGQRLEDPFDSFVLERISSHADVNTEKINSRGEIPPVKLI